METLIKSAKIIAMVFTIFFALSIANPGTQYAQFDKIKKAVDKEKKDDKDKKEKKSEKKTDKTKKEKTTSDENSGTTTSTGGKGTNTGTAVTGNQQKDRQAMRQEHENFLQSLRKDAWEYYDMPVTMEYGTDNSATILRLAQTFDYYPRVVIADSICYKVYTPKELETGTIWQNFVWVAKTFWNFTRTS